MRIRQSNSAVKGLAVILTLACIGGGTVYAGSVVSKNNLIGEDAAEEFAVLDADVTWDEVSGLYTYLERDKGRYIYDIEFYAGRAKYEYEILAEDGSILDKEVEVKELTSSSESSERTGSSQKEEADPQAAEAAESPQKEEADLQTADRTAAKASDPANTSGTKPDTASDRAPASAVGAEQQMEAKAGYLSVDEAKKIALDHAGLTEDQVRFSTAKFDDDDSEGEEYEIEFYIGQTEYEYEIDARTGAIRDFSKEIDDDD